MRGFKTVVLLSALALLLGPRANADVLGPYPGGAGTTHLWHLNDPAGSTSTLDAVGNLDLEVLNGATLGNLSFPGFNTAIDCGPDAASGVFSEDIPVDSFWDQSTGAFSYEAIFQLSGTVLTGNEVYQIFSLEDDGGADSRPFQFRFEGPAHPENANGVPQLDFLKIAGGLERMVATLPTSGAHAAVAGNWYHVAVTYNGSEATADNFKFYWTAMSSSATEANLLISLQMNGDLVDDDGVADFAIGNENRATGGSSDNYPGLIDEVRISNVVRGAGDFLFGPPSQPLAVDPIIWKMLE